MISTSSWQDKILPIIGLVASILLIHCSVDRGPESSEVVQEGALLPVGHPFQSCAVCHGARGEGNPQLLSPRLAGQRREYLQGQIRAFQEGWRGADPQDVQGKLMSVAISPLSNEQIDAALAYLEELPETFPATPMVQPNARGKYLYKKGCQICHSEDGKGPNDVKMVPRLDMQYAWYTQRQMENYRSRLRGFHPDDEIGEAMGFYARLLPDDQAVKDVVEWLSYQAAVKSKREHK